MNKAALQELVEASVGSLRDCSEQYAALKDRHRALLARVAVLERALEKVAEFSPTYSDHAYLGDVAREALEGDG